jgi:hypothetical protein
MLLLPTLRSTIVCTFAFLFTSALLHAQTFTNPYRIPTPVDPDTVVAGDLNGDGRPDILWTDSSVNPHILHTLLAQPSGNYLALPNVTLPADSTDFCLLADFNLDHHLDLVCSAAQGLNASIEVFLGNGDGSFQSPVITALNTYNSGSNAYPLISLIGDVNGDGLPDLFEEDANGTAQILLGDGKGGFGPGIEIQSGINGLLPVTADVNGDGHPDLLFPGGPSVALGKGDGTFSSQTSYAAPSYYDATCIFHDMDGDGHLDALCGYQGTSGGDITGSTDLIILHGNPDGSFNTTPVADKTFGDKDSEFDGFGTFQTPLAVADLNGDGILDVIGSSGDGLAILLGGSGLTFSTPLHYAQAFVGYGVGMVYYIYQSQIIDMNGDGIPDIVASGPHGVYISYGKKDGSFTSAFSPEVTEVIGYPTVADFNGDGIPDIAATGDTAIKLSLGRGNGTFDPPIALPNNNGAVNFSTPLSATNAHILHGDFNGDGKLDLLAIGSSSIYQYDSYLLYGHGDGTFASPLLVPNSSTLFPMYVQLTDDAVFDINGDGRSDLLGSSTTSIPNAPAQIYFALSKGDGTFKTVTTTIPADLQYGSYPYLTFPALADFNHDGKLDAAYGSVTNAYVVNGHGDGTFDTTSTALPLPAISGTASQSAIAVATGDFDDDGNQDFVVLAQYGAGQFPYPSPVATAAWVFYGNGNGTFTAPVLAGTFDRNYSNIAAADLNRDGLADLVLKTSGSLGGGYSVGVISSQPGRTFGPEVNYTAGTGLSSLAITDLNHDGLPDLVFGNGDYNIRASSVTVLLNQGSSSGGGTGSDATTTTTTLTCTPSTLSIGSTSLFSAMVTSTSGTPTGSITFTDNGAALSQSTLTNGAATYTYTNLSTGNQTIVATYVPTGSFTASSDSCALTVTGVPSSATLTVAPTVAAEGTPVTLTASVSGDSGGRGSPPGTITFYNGSTVLDSGARLVAGTVSFTTTTLPPGIDYLTCTYSGSGAFAPSSCNIVPVTITSSSSAIALTSSLNPAPNLTPITFTAQVPPGSGGTIIFNVNGQNIPTTPNAAGTSTYTISTLTFGSYLITATWFATSNALGAQASLVQVVTYIPPPSDFSLTGTNITFQIAHSGTGQLQLVSLNGFNGNVALTCSLPSLPGYTCTLQSSSVSLASGFSAVIPYTLTPTYTASSHPLHRSARSALASLFPLSFFWMIGLARKRRTPISKLLSLTLLAILATATTACGPDHFIPITIGTFPITFTATGTSQGSSTPITHTLTLNATITP